MGIFALYAGLIYDDFASLSLPLFKSSFPIDWNHDSKNP